MGDSSVASFPQNDRELLGMARSEGLRMTKNEKEKPLLLLLSLWEILRSLLSLRMTGSCSEWQEVKGSE